MTILILGAAGNLGTALIEYLDEYEGISAIGWDKADIDVSDQGLLSKKIIELSPNVIINTVAYNDVDRMENDEAAQELGEKLNVELVKNLSAIALEIKATLIHYSSDYVFNGEKETAYTEDDAPDPQSVYAQSKFAGEEVLVSATGKGLQWYLIRTSKLFGPRGLSVGAKPSFFELMFRLSQSNNTIKAVNDEVGSFTYTRDLARATISLIEDESPYGIYHIVNDGEASWYEAAQYFFKKLGKDIELIPVNAAEFPRPARRPKHSLLASVKRSPMRSWQEAVDDYCSHETFI